MEWLNWLHKLAAKRIKLKETSQVAATPDISEPVISFLKVFESNPRRFKIKYTKTSADDACDGYTAYNFVDTLTKERFSYLHRFYNPEKDLYGIKGLPDYLTQDEKKLIVDTLWHHYTDRKNRFVHLKSIRTKRKQANERKRLTKIYREE